MTISIDASHCSPAVERPRYSDMHVCTNVVTGKPYWENRYTEKFRVARKKAGVPDHVWSMDSRTVAVSETVEATGSLEAARDLATHTTTKTARRYSRGDGLEASRKIAEARAEKRK